MCGCPDDPLAERGLLGYNHWPSQPQGGGSVRLIQLSRPDVAAPYLKTAGSRSRSSQGQGHGQGQGQGQGGAVWGSGWGQARGQNLRVGVRVGF